MMPEGPSDGLRELSKAFGSAPAKYYYRQPEDRGPQCEELARRIKAFQVQQGSPNLRYPEEFAFHLGGDDQNEVVLCTYVPIADNPEIAGLIASSDRSFDLEKPLVGAFISHRFLDVDETRRRAGIIVGYDEGLIVTGTGVSGDTRTFLIDRSGVSSLPPVTLTSAALRGHKKSFAKIFPDATTRSFYPADRLLAVQANRLVSTPLSIGGIQETPIGPDTVLFHGLERRRVLAAKASSVQPEVGPLPPVADQASPSATAIKVAGKSATVLGTSLSGAFTPEVRVSGPGGSTTASQGYGSTSSMPIGFEGCAEDETRQGCRDCVNERTALAAGAIFTTAGACFAKAGAVGAAIAAIPCPPFTQITGGAVLAVGIGTCTAAAAGLTALLYVKSTKAAKECFRESWTDENGNPIQVTQSGLVSAVTRDDSGRISQLLGKRLDGTIWHIEVSEAIEWMRSGVPFFVSSPSGGYTPIARRSYKGVPYLATLPNGNTADNLSSLPVIDQDDLGPM